MYYVMCTAERAKEGKSERERAREWKDTEAEMEYGKYENVLARRINGAIACIADTHKHRNHFVAPSLRCANPEL